MGFDIRKKVVDFFCGMAHSSDAPVHPLNEPTCEEVYRRRTTFVVSFTSLVIAGYVSLAGPEVRNGSLTFIKWMSPLHEIPPVNLNWIAITFWVSALIWAVGLHIRINLEDATTSRQLNHLLSAVHYSPDLNILEDYPQILRVIKEEYLEILNSKQRDKISTMKSRVVGIRFLLEEISELAKSFAGNTRKENYHVNIMIVLKPKENDPFFEELLKNIKFHRPENWKTLQALLYLPPPLVYPEENSIKKSDMNKPYPNISLPVPSSHRDMESESLALPGAPTALIKGYSIHEDTRLIHEEYQHLASWKVKKLKSYFSQNGQGSKVRSFASYRIGTNKKPVGVVNIDSDFRNVLGADPQFYNTFGSLLTPILQYLEQPVQEYSSLLRESFEKGLEPEKAKTESKEVGT